MEGKVWLCWVWLVMLMVRVAGRSVAVWMPKSSSRVEMAMGFGGVVVAGRVAVWVGALVAWTVMLPGPVPVKAMVHSPPGASVVPQLWVGVKLVAVIWRFVATAEPKLRRVMLGESSVESARLGAAVVGSSLVRKAAEPEHRLPLQVPGARTALLMVEGRAVVGALVRGRS